jgi:hypothetical protein
LLVRRQEITIGVAGAVVIGLNGELVATVPVTYYLLCRFDADLMPI